MIVRKPKLHLPDGHSPGTLAEEGDGASGLYEHADGVHAWLQEMEET
jgi:hypothetical protein